MILPGSNIGASKEGGDPNKPIPFLSNHGNAVAGIIGATKDNNIGIAGICPKCKILPVKLPDISNPTELASAFDLVRNTAQIVNLSISAPSVLKQMGVFRESITRCLSSNIFIMCTK